jgi:hypothetical protein
LLPAFGGKIFRYRDLVDPGFVGGKNLSNLDLVANICFLDLVDKVCFLRLVAKVPNLDLVALGFVGGKNLCILDLVANVFFMDLQKLASWIWLNMDLLVANICVTWIL